MKSEKLLRVELEYSKISDTRGKEKKKRLACAVPSSTCPSPLASRLEDPSVPEGSLDKAV